MRRIFILLIILFALSSILAVSADTNITDSPQQEDVLAQSEDVLLTNGSSQEVTKTTSQISSSDVKGYSSFSTKVSFKLTSDSKSLASKSVSVLINGVKYDRTTDNNGESSVSVNLKAGSYTAEFNYLGDDNTTSAHATSKIKITASTKTYLKLGDKDINYRQGLKNLFFVKLVTKSGKAIKNQKIVFTIKGKTYTAKTNKKGIAKLFLNLKKGKYKVKYSFKKKAPYLASSGSHTIKVKAKMKKGNGYWLWPAHMKSINLKKLSKKGTKHLILHSYAIHVHGKSAVVSFIKRAHKHGIKVHLWMQVAYDGKWVSLVNGKGKLKYSFMNKKIAEAKRYAKIKGVDGIHFDYIRYGGTAHKHPNAIKSINYFAKKASVAIHKIKPNCIVSAALMPEPKMMHYYYGQDVPTMSKYMDALLPMVYKGNYHKPTSWITSVTKTFAKQSNGAQIWTGLQSYHSDNNVKRLSQKTLVKHSKAAMKGGAKGVILFRIGISCNFNFNKV